MDTGISEVNRREANGATKFIQEMINYTNANREISASRKQESKKRKDINDSVHNKKKLTKDLRNVENEEFMTLE